LPRVGRRRIGALAAGKVPPLPGLLHGNSRPSPAIAVRRRRTARPPRRLAREGRSHLHNRQSARPKQMPQHMQRCTHFPFAPDCVLAMAATIDNSRRHVTKRYRLSRCRCAKSCGGQTLLECGAHATAATSLHGQRTNGGGGARSGRDATVASPSTGTGHYSLRCPRDAPKSFPRPPKIVSRSLLNCVSAAATAP